MNNEISYQFSNEKEFQEEIERCCENNRNKKLEEQIQKLDLKRKAVRLERKKYNL